MPDGAGFAFAQGILAVTGEKIYFLPPGTKPHSMNIAFVRIQPTGTTKTTSMLKRTFFITAPVAALLLLASCSGGDHAKTDEMMAHNKAMMAADSLTKAIGLFPQSTFPIRRFTGRHRAPTAMKAVGRPLFYAPRVG